MVGFGPALGFALAAEGVRRLTNKNWDNKTRVPLIIQQANAARRRCYGKCGEYTAVEFQHLMQKDIGPLDFMYLTDGDHAFCLLNRPESSDPTDASTWGREVWVIDGWKGELFDMPDPMRFEKIIGKHKYDSYVRWP